MRFDRRNRLLVPLRFTQAVQLSATLVNFGGYAHPYFHRLRVRVPERGRVFRLPVKPKALEAMRSRGRRAYVGIWLTARDAEGELMHVPKHDRLDGWALETAPPLIVHHRPHSDARAMGSAWPRNENAAEAATSSPSPAIADVRGRSHRVPSQTGSAAGQPTITRHRARLDRGGATRRLPPSPVAVA